MATEVLMPRQGQSVESCIIIGWSVAEGETINEGEIICDIETDKAAFDVESPASGTVLGIFYPVDSDVEVLKVIAVIGEPGEDISALRPLDDDAAEVEAPVADSVETEIPETALPIEPVKAPVASSGVSPRAKNLAKNKGVDTATIAGTGPHGRVIERDVMAAQPAVISPAAKDLATAEGLEVPAVGSGIGGRVVASDLRAVAPLEVAAAIASMDFPGSVTEIPVKGIRNKNRSGIFDFTQQVP